MMQKISTTGKNTKPTIRLSINRTNLKDEPLDGWITDDLSSNFFLEDETGIETWMKEKQISWLARGIRRCQLLFDDQDSCGVLGRNDHTARPASEGGIRNFEHLDRTSLKLKEGLVNKTNTWYGLVHDRRAAGSLTDDQKPEQNGKFPSDISRRRRTAGIFGPEESPIITMLRFQEKLRSKREVKVDRLRERLFRLSDIRAESNGKEMLLPSRVSFTYGKFDEAFCKSECGLKVTDRETDPFTYGKLDAALRKRERNIKVNDRETDPFTYGKRDAVFRKRERNIKMTNPETDSVEARTARNDSDPSSVVVNSKAKRDRKKDVIIAEDMNTRQRVAYLQTRSSPTCNTTNQLLRECSLRTRINLGSAKGKQLKYQSTDSNYLDYLKHRFETSTSKFETDIQDELEKSFSDYKDARVQEDTEGLESSEPNQSKEEKHTHVSPFADTLSKSSKLKRDIQDEFANPSSERIEVRLQEDTASFESSELNLSKEGNNTHLSPFAVRFPKPLDSLASRRGKQHMSSVRPDVRALVHMSRRASRLSYDSDVSDATQSISSYGTSESLPVLSPCFLTHYYSRERSACKSKEIHLPSLKVSQFKCPLKRFRDMTDRRVQFQSGKTECSIFEGKGRFGPLITKKNPSSERGTSYQDQTTTGDMMVVNRIGNKGTCYMRMPGRCPSEADSGLGE